MVHRLTRPQSTEVEGSSEAVADTPTTIDFLGFKRFTVPIARRIAKLSEGNTPLTIGVHGEWGSGKTSFLLMIDEDLHQEDIYPIWFNAWKYDKEENLWSALLQTILNQARVSGRWYRRGWVKCRIWWNSIDLRSGLWQVTKKLAPVITRSLLVLVSAVLVLGWSAAEIETYLNGITSRWLSGNIITLAVLEPHIVKSIIALVGFVAAKPNGLLKLFDTQLGIDFSRFSRRPTYREHIAFLDQFTNEFQRIIQLVGRGKPLVVIIDDLDRCLPEKAVQVLEAIKLFMDVKGCVFLLAIDREIVEKMIAVKYKDILATKREPGVSPDKPVTFHQDYTEKIIQLPISLPRLSDRDIARFVKNLSVDGDIQLCAEIFGAGLRPNPRKIKRALRAFLFVRDVAAHEIEAGDIKPSLLAKLVIIQDRFPVVYQTITKRPSLLRALERYYLARTEDQSLDQIAVEYDAQYPRLRQVLLQKVNEGDTFIGTHVDRYVALVGAIAEVKQIEDKLTPELVRYLRYILTSAHPLDFRGVASSQPVVLDLEKAFVTPQFRTLWASKRAEPTAHSTSSSHVERRAMALDLTGVLRSSGRIAILGDPGSGKTTLLRYLAVVSARTALETDASPAETLLAMQETPVPILVPLREYSQYEEQTGDVTPTPAALTEFLEHYFARWSINLRPGFFSQYLERGKCLVLLDGLDEVVPDKRYFVVESIDVLCARYPMNRYIVTSRTVSFREETIRPQGFEVYALAPWDTSQVSAFIRALLPEEIANDLEAKVAHNTQVGTLVSNPLLLTVITLMHRFRSELPVTRAEMLDEATRLLLGEWDRAKGLSDIGPGMDAVEIRRLLASLALLVQQNRETTVDKATILQIFAQELGEPVEKIVPILTAIRERSGLLVERVPGSYVFFARSFQEYLAAVALTSRPNFVHKTLELWHRDGAVWREVVLFEIAYLSKAGRGQVAKLLQALLDDGEPRSIILAAEGLLEIGEERVEGALAEDILYSIDCLRTDKSIEPFIRAQAEKLKQMMQS